jgi:hypothetical protein
VTKRDLILVASRAMALYLIFWALDHLSYVPVDAFALSHYGSLQTGRQNYQNYLYMQSLILLIRHVIYAVFLFVASVWIYRCGPTISRFLSFPEE